MTSVIVPVYNGERTIEACLRSITAQTESNLEILVIDDGSVDDTNAICHRLAAKDSRIRLFSQKNAGVSAARNFGLQEAKGDYVTFVDADDLLPPRAVETLRREAQSGADFVIGSHTCFRGVWEQKRIHSLADAPETLMSLMCGKLYRRAILEGNNLRFPEGLPYGEDTVFNLQYHRAAPKTVVLGDVVYRCRMGGTASSLRYYPNRAEIACTLVEAYQIFCTEADVQRIAQKELTETVMHYLVHCPFREAQRRAADARERLSPFLPENFWQNGTMAGAVLRQHWLRILLRKLKKRIKGQLL